MKITFKKFLSEEEKISDDEAVEYILSSDWNKLIGGWNNTKNLYRGMRVMWSPDITIQYPRSNRRPLTTDSYIHDQANNYFFKKYGIKFRSEAIFASRHVNLAENYGQPYVVFPHGNVSYAWSEIIEDFTSDFNAIALRKSNNIYPEPEQFEEYMDDMEYHINDNSLDKYYNNNKFKKYEIMIKCDEYLAIYANYFNKHIVPLLEE